MKRYLLGLILFIMIILVGCASSEDISINNNDENSINKTEFEIVSKQDIHIDKGVNDNDTLVIVKYKKTGKLFIIYKGSRKGGVTPLD